MEYHVPNWLRHANLRHWLRHAIPWHKAASPSPRSPAQRTKQRRRRIWSIGISIVVLMAVLTQSNGVVGAWAADRLRAVLGPQATAQIEAWYLGAGDALSQIRYHLPGQTVAPPFHVTPTATPAPGSTATATSGVAISPMALPPLPPLISPPLAAEGIWQVIVDGPATANVPPSMAKAFFRPDTARPYAIVTLLQIDPRFATLHIIAGKNEPGGPLGKHGPGVIPPDALVGQQLLAAFNGGFKYADGHYGLKADGTVYVPPVSGQATIAITRTGTAFIGAWGVDPRLTNANTSLRSWRQNGALLIDNGVLNPLTQDGRAWGGTVLNSTYTWRSGIGITPQGTMIYAGGNALSAATLGEALLAAGATMAMQTDINPYWVRAFTYMRDANGRLIPSKLNPGMQGRGMEFIQGEARDFFYITRRSASVIP